MDQLRFGEHQHIPGLGTGVLKIYGITHHWWKNPPVEYGYVKYEDQRYQVIRVGREYGWYLRGPAPEEETE